MTSGEARDEMFSLLKTAWDLKAPAFSVMLNGVPVKPAIYWQGIEYSDPPRADVPYADASVVHTLGRQTGMGSVGSRLYTYDGVIVVQCYGPTGSGKALTIAEGLANIAKDAYEGRSSPNGIWFRNARVAEMGMKDGWTQVVANIDFSYDEVK